MLQELIKKYPQFEEQLQGSVIPEEVIDAGLQVEESQKEEREEESVMEEKMKYCVGCSTCVYECEPNKNSKVLRKCEATSILCRLDLLTRNSRLRMVTKRGNNRYFSIDSCNTTIMYVEDSFCIILDSMVQTYNSNGEWYSLPCMLSAQHYGVYQNDQGRDWVKGTSGNRPIGHDIQDLVYGNGAKVARQKGYTLDHGAETHNEKLVNCIYKLDNRNEGSHKIVRVLDTPEKLDEYIDAVIAKGENPGYII